MNNLLTKKHMNLHNMSNILLIKVFQHLDVHSLMEVMKVCRFWRKLIDESCEIWRNLSLENIWPSLDTLHMFNRCISCNNLEATIKLTIAYIYKEGDLNFDENTNNQVKIDCHVYEYLEKLDVICENLNVPPMGWLLIRPPWNTQLDNLKLNIFKRLLVNTKKMESKSANKMYTLSKTIGFLKKKYNNNEIKLKLMVKASKKGSFWATIEQLNVSFNDSLTCFPRFYSNNPNDQFNFDHYRQLLSIYEHMNNAHRVEQTKILSPIIQINCLYKSVQVSNQSPNSKNLTDQKFFLLNQLFNMTSCNYSHLATKYSKRRIYDESRSDIIDWLFRTTTLLEFHKSSYYLTILLLDLFASQKCSSFFSYKLIAIGCLYIVSKMQSEECLTINDTILLADYSWNYGQIVRIIGEILSRIYQYTHQKMTLFDLMESITLTCDVTEDVGHFFYLLSNEILLYLDQINLNLNIICSSILLIDLILLNQTSLIDTIMENIPFFYEKLSIIRPSVIKLYNLYYCNLSHESSHNYLNAINLANFIYSKNVTMLNSDEFQSKTMVILNDSNWEKPKSHLIKSTIKIKPKKLFSTLDINFN